MTPRWDVLGIGENSVDHVCGVPGAPGTNVKLPITNRRVSFGGQVTTTLCTCRALGLRAAYLGAFGHDADGARLRAELRRRDVDLEPSVTRPVPNRSALVFVNDATGDRSVFWERDAQLTLRPTDISPTHIAAARLLHVDNVDEEAALAAARLAHDLGIPVTCDIDRVTALTASLLAVVSVPVLAEHVPEALTGVSDLSRALRTLRHTHPGPLCVTLGPRGSVVLDGDTLHHAPAFAVPVVDTTGAGDVFRGACIVALLRGDAPKDMIRFANAAAAVSCTRVGAIDGVPALAEIERLLRT